MAAHANSHPVSLGELPNFNGGTVTTAAKNKKQKEEKLLIYQLNSNENIPPGESELLRQWLVSYLVGILSQVNHKGLHHG